MSYSKPGWIQKIQIFGSKFKDGAVTDCADAERAGKYIVGSLTKYLFHDEGYIQIQRRKLLAVEMTTVSTICQGLYGKKTSAVISRI
jgi:hypothetical protein